MLFVVLMTSAIVVLLGGLIGAGIVGAVALGTVLDQPLKRAGAWFDRLPNSTIIPGCFLLGALPFLALLLLAH